MSTSNNERIVQRMVADSYDLCVQKIIKLWGTEYQILQKRPVKVGGFLGFGKRDAMEITFVVTQETQYPRYKNYTSMNYNNPITAQKPMTTSSFDFEREKEKILSDKKVSLPQIQEVLTEIQSLRKDISNIQPYSQEDEHETVVKIRKLLESNEFLPNYINKILERLKKEFTIEELEDYEFIQEAVVDWIGDSIQIANIDLKSRPQVIILVGPTGVGKTTTVAKIAARYNPNASSHPLRVTLLNADNYRIGAKDQIETYANLLSIPLQSIDKDGDFANKVNSFGANTDVIIVDTFGCSQKDYEKIGVLRRRLELKGVVPEVYLTITAMTKASDMKDILQQFEVFAYKSVIVTKLDETSCIGNLISVLDEKNKSLAYLTTGQSVPSDIEVASANQLLMLLNGFKINKEHIDEKYSNTNSDNGRY